MSEVIFRNGTILTIDPNHRVLAGDVACVDGVIVHIGGTYTAQTSDYEIVPLAGGNSRLEIRAVNNALLATLPLAVVAEP